MSFDAVLYRQIRSAAVAAGIPDNEKADIAAAVAMAESSGRSTAVGDIDKPHTGCRSYGLWQINSCPDRDRTGVRADTAKLLTVQGNAAAMVAISARGTNWSPWTTYRNGAYRQFLEAARKAGATGKGGTPGVAGPAIDAAAGAVADNAGAIATINDAIMAVGRLATFVLSPGNWYRVALFVLGLLVLVAGLLFIFRGPIAQTATALT